MFRRPWFWWLVAAILVGAIEAAHAGRQQVKANPSGDWTFSGGIRPLCVKQADLASANNVGLPAGFMLCCSDCTQAAPCAGGGTGALAKRFNNIWDCSGGGGGGGSTTTLTADSGGATTGTAVTLAGGVGISTLRSADTVTVNVASQESGFLTAASTDLTCGGGNAGRMQVGGLTDPSDLQYCSNIGTPVLRSPLSAVPTDLATVANQVPYYSGTTTFAVRSSKCVYLGDATPGWDCPANSTQGGVLSIKENSSFAGNNQWGFQLGATDLTADVFFTPNTAGKIDGSAFLQNTSVTNAQINSATITHKQRIWMPAAGCDTSTASAVFDLPASNGPTKVCSGTNVRQGFLQYPDSGGAPGYNAQIGQMMPDTWLVSGGARAATARVFWNTPATSLNVKFTGAIVCTTPDVGSLDDTAYPTSSNGFASATVTTNGTGSSLQSTALTFANTGCSISNVNQMLHLKIFRDGTDAADTIGNVWNFVGVQFEYDAVDMNP